VPQASPEDSRLEAAPGVKAEAFFHLTANFNYILMSILSILMFPSMVIRRNMGWYEMMLIDISAVLCGHVLGLQLLHDLPARRFIATGVPASSTCLF